LTCFEEVLRVALWQRLAGMQFAISTQPFVKLMGSLCLHLQVDFKTTCVEMCGAVGQWICPCPAQACANVLPTEMKLNMQSLRGWKTLRWTQSCSVP
jgi:hypothetical protein